MIIKMWLLVHTAIVEPLSLSLSSFFLPRLAEPQHLEIRRPIDPETSQPRQ